MHVLIIEDEPLIALDIQSFLENLIADTSDIAETEDEALKLAHDHRPDLITADYSLRHGTGPSAVDRIRNDVGKVPVIYITGQPERCARDAIAITKPIRWIELVQAVDRYELAAEPRGLCRVLSSH